jgi:hypothetical protein
MAKMSKVSNNEQLITRVHPETVFSDVILRSPANSGTTKNLEILRPAQAGLRMTKRRFLRCACPELV